MTTAFSGIDAGSAKPCAVSLRSRCFIDTVSPRRSSVRSKMVCARTVCFGLMSVGTLKRHVSMPRFQFDITKAMSALPRAFGWSAAIRAETK
ncbi:hypothetical protein D3C85_1090620 [compost metagenome]